MIICDDVFRDEQTHKLILVGTFNSIWTDRLPCVHPKMCVLFTLTNGNGTYDSTLTIEHEKTAEKVVELSGPMNIADPLSIADFHVELGKLKFRHAGKYWVALSADGEILQQRPFNVAQMSPGEEQGQ